MKITRLQLQQAAEQQLIEPGQVGPLFDFLSSRNKDQPLFDFTHVLYYLGGLVAIGAMSLFMTLGWERFGGWGIFFICLAYAGVGLKLAGHFERLGHVIPAGICATFVIALTPLAIYGLQQAMGWWPDSTAYRDYHRYIKWHWLYLELGTLAMGIVLAWRYRYPFMMMPLAVTLWYLSMDLVVMLAGGYGDFILRAQISMAFGLVMTLIAFWVDMRNRSQRDFAFWLYIFGVLTFWGGLSSQHSDSELAKFLYFSINLAMIGIGAVLLRRVFVVFGAIGSAGYLGHLASTVFRDSWLFPISLTLIGLGIIYLGILWQKNEQAIGMRLRARLPMELRHLLTERG
jgi:hypothetical protein